MMRVKHRDSDRRIHIMGRVMANVHVNENGCWNWKGGHSGNGRGGGYGRISINGGTMAVHRVVYTCMFGPIPPKKQVDHTCKNRACCNPEHLLLVTPRANCKRRDGKI